MKTQLPDSTRRNSGNDAKARRTWNGSRVLSTGLAAVFLASAVPLTTQPASAQLGNWPPTANRQDMQMNTTVRGVVVRSADTRSGVSGAFELRADNGETFRVLAHQDLQFLTDSTSWLNNTQVEVDGIRDGDAILARDVRLFENGRYLSVLRGVVQSDARGDRFQLTVGNRVVQVQARNASVRDVRRGDEVEVRGTWTGQGRGNWNSVFDAQSVNLVRNDQVGYPGDDQYEDGRFVTLRGTVTEPDRNNRFRITLSNNRSLNVLATNNVRLVRNDYVEVSGRWNRNEQLFRADSVRVLDDRFDDRNAARVNFPGTIVEVRSATRLSVRGDNGRIYEVVSTMAVDRNLRRNDRVRVTGTADRDGTVRADRIVLERDGTGSVDGQRIDFTGVVNETPIIILRNHYLVRADNGREYRVMFNRTTNVRRGDRVRVSGRLVNDTVEADVFERN